MLLFVSVELNISDEELLEMDFNHFIWVFQQLVKREEPKNARNANLMCLLANINRGKNKKAYSPKDFMPKKPKTQKEIDDGILSALGIQDLKKLD